MSSTSFHYPTDQVISGINSRFPNPRKGYSIDGSIINSYDVEFLPINSVDNGIIDDLYIQFHVPPSREFLDLSRLNLFVELEIRKGDNSRERCVEADLYSIVNSSLNSLWSSVELMLNGTLVLERNDMHGFVSYLQTVLGMPGDMKETIGSAMGYSEGIVMSKTTLAKMTSAKKDELPAPVTAWMSKTAKSKNLQLMGALYTDLASLDTFLLDGVSLDLRLHRQQNPYFINTAKPDADYRFVIKQCRLQVRKVLPTTNAHLALNRSLEMYGVQRYFYKRLTTKSYNLQARELSKVIEDPFSGIVPNLLIVALVPHSAMHGTYGEDPFYLHNQALSRLALTVDGTMIKDYHMSYEDNQYMIPYYYNFIHYGLEHATNGLKPEEFKDGKNVYIFDLTADDQATGASNLTLDRKGLLRLNFVFKTAPTENLTLVLIGMSQAAMGITADRRVLLNYLM
jgi:hypothetical protein